MSLLLGLFLHVLCVFCLVETFFFLKGRCCRRVLSTQELSCFSYEFGSYMYGAFVDVEDYFGM